MATLEKVAEVAKVDPHIALNIVAANTVAIARPPGTRPINLYAASYNLCAIPAWKAICNMETGYYYEPDHSYNGYAKSNLNTGHKEDDKDNTGGQS
jgi:hypothetical protein